MGWKPGQLAALLAGQNFCTSGSSRPFSSTPSVFFWKKFHSPAYFSGSDMIVLPWQNSAISKIGMYYKCPFCENWRECTLQVPISGCRSSCQKLVGHPCPLRACVEVPQDMLSSTEWSHCGNPRADKLRILQDIRSTRGPQYMLPSNCITWGTSKKEVAAACRQGLQTDTWGNKSPEGLSKHQPGNHRCISTAPFSEQCVGTAEHMTGIVIYC